MSAAADASRPGAAWATRPETSAAANPAKWKWATVRASTGSSKPISSYPARSATSDSPATAGVTSAVSTATSDGRSDRVRSRRTGAVAASARVAPA